MKPLIYLFSTGGTISEQSTKDGAVPLKGHEDWLLAHLEEGGITVRMKPAPVAKGSAHLVPEDWKTIARAVADAIREGAHGVVVLHGTDTMQYTASALSFMLSGLTVPVVMTGSMIPGADPGSDAPFNVQNAVTVAAYSDLAEICIVFSADQRKSRGMILRGCRARKIHSTHLDAFTSVNLSPLGYVKEGKIIYTRVQRRKRGTAALKLSLDLDPNVVLVKQHPAITARGLEHLLEGASGAVLEGTGAGHLRTELHEVIASFNRPVVMTTQAIFGGVRWGMYASDQAYLGIKNLIPGGDMTGETALVKLMWALGQKGDVRSTMLTDFAGELNPKGIR